MISVLDLLNVLDRSLTVRETVKKSKASQVCILVNTPPNPSIHNVDQGPAEAQVLAIQLGNTYPCEEGDYEESPLVSVELPDQAEGIGKLGHRRLQAAEARRDVLADAHAVVRRLITLLDAQRGGLVVISGKLTLGMFDGRFLVI